MFHAPETAARKDRAFGFRRRGEHHRDRVDTVPEVLVGQALAFEDVPQEGLDVEAQTFDTWVKWGLNDPTVVHDAYFIAVHGDEYVGLRELGRDPDTDVLLGGPLGVRRAYRRQGIGLAMQVRGITYAKEHGYPELKTCTAVQNEPMQAIFNKLRYTRGPEWLQCQKDINAEYQIE